MGPLLIRLFPGAVRFIRPVQTVLVVELDVRPFVGTVVSPFAVADGMNSSTGLTLE